MCELWDEKMPNVQVSGDSARFADLKKELLTLYVPQQKCFSRW